MSFSCHMKLEIVLEVADSNDESSKKHLFRVKWDPGLPVIYILAA